ncbi:UDP-N-acetylmuramate--L-alanine ligase [Amycolatopsis silviterrae]|uniref:UDP-N-acetylmuramate--L-alanine ligase n=1 Tax=Amycolatopsis silviterrae TaxID=1656914 RepID=A0ABW5HBZ6_9PSEU
MNAGRMTAADLGRVHVVGCGGVGMSGLAEILLRRGFPVSGSERDDRPSLARLRKLGCAVSSGHDESALDDVDTVVYSTAIPDDHPELAAARRRGLRVLHRSEALAAVMAGYRSVAVTGTHGKTSTTGMVVSALWQSGIDLSFVVGGDLAGHGSAAHGSSDVFVAEADESDRSFLHYAPHAAVVTNIDSDHLDTYGDLAGLSAAFLQFCGQVQPGGFVVTSADDSHCRALAERARTQGLTVYTYGRHEDADLRVSGLSSSATRTRYHAHLDGTPLGEVIVPVPGAHLGLNSAAALLTTVRLGVSAEKAIEGLRAYPGVGRRFELKGFAGGVRVYDDYAGHHTALAASLRALRHVAGRGQLIAVCQPCGTFRTQHFQAELAAALGLADQAIVMEVFERTAADERGHDGAELAQAVPLATGSKAFAGSWSETIGEVTRRARPGDLVVTLGAAPMSLMADQILGALRVRKPGGVR